LSSLKLWAHEAGGERFSLPVADWSSSRLPGDEALLARCAGPTLDVGCGPGRLVAALATRGAHALGIDISSAAVSQARSRAGNVNALQRCVFGPVPGAGLWEHALLADGNIGIGGDPVALLRRVSALLTPQGLIHAELAPPGAASVVRHLQLEDVTRRVSESFPWAEVGFDTIETLATASGLEVAETWYAADRWFASLRRPVFSLDFEGYLPASA
jgi:SAM-dependent methyltransferase